jgi:hypothetical protein
MQEYLDRNRLRPGRQRCVVLSTYFMSKLMGRQDSVLEVEDCLRLVAKKALRVSLPNAEPADVRFLMMPVHLANHWVRKSMCRCVCFIKNAGPLAQQASNDCRCSLLWTWSSLSSSS